MSSSAATDASFAVAIPTKNRSEKLARCLTALEAAREEVPFPIYVADSSTDPVEIVEVEDVCRRHPMTVLHRHAGQNVSAARNACVRVCREKLIVNVDDDISVESPAIRRLVEHYLSARGPRVVGGSVAWDGFFKGPLKLRLHGYGSAPRPGERTDFLVGAFFVYPRALGLALPWNERIRFSDDRFMGALWRQKGITLLDEEGARAIHDPEPGHVYEPRDQWSHVYTNLFDAVLANPDPKRALAYEILGFTVGGRQYLRDREIAREYARAWARGHRALYRDRAYLRDLLRQTISGIEW
jgi:glycosyltransferase involved in cell wall biosynthesis